MSRDGNTIEEKKWMLMKHNGWCRKNGEKKEGVERKNAFFKKNLVIKNWHCCQTSASIMCITA